MSKLSDEQHEHNPDLPQRPPNYYLEMLRNPPEESPIEAALARRLDQGEARQQIRDLHDQVMTALGDKTQLFLDLDLLETTAHVEREEAFFNIGYEHGFAAAAAYARRGPLVLSEAAQRIADDTRDRLIQAELSPGEATLTLLECLWAVAVTDRNAQQMLVDASTR